MIELFSDHQLGVTIEITTRCALRCSKCKKTIYQIGSTDLSLRKIKSFARQIKRSSPGCTIHLTGNCGDPIYHPQFHRVLSLLKHYGFHVWITTNGAHRDQAWWNQTADTLTQEDGIIFSIDGLEDTNALYREGSNWQSIMSAILIVSSKVQTVWKMIVFEHNQHQVEACKQLAHRLHMTQFQTMKSARFKEGDRVRPPTLPQYQSVQLAEKAQLKNAVKNKERVLIKPRCSSKNELFISYQGKVYPCCSFWDGPEAPLSLFKKLFQSSIRAQLSKWKNCDPAQEDVCLRRCGTVDPTYDYQDDLVHDPLS